MANQLLDKWINELLDRQAESWEAGTRVAVEELLAAVDTVAANDSELRRTLIAGEIALRRERGETGNLEPEYRRRFPHDIEAVWEEATFTGLSQALNPFPTALRSTDHGQHFSTIATLPELIPASPDSPTIPGAPQIADFVILKAIGQGGFGTVWLAQNRLDGKLVALKQLERGLGVEIDGLRLLRGCEAQVPRLLRILHVGRSVDGLYYTMPLADDLHGTSHSTAHDVTAYQPYTLAAQVANHGGLTVQETIQLGENLAESLAALHSFHLVHADIKPDNILRVAGEWHIGDFGLMTLIRSNHSSEEARGTRRYWPPEGLSGQATDDLYALALTLQQSCSQLSTALPSTRSSGWRPRYHATQERWAGRRLKRVLSRALHADPARRYQTAADFHKSLRGRSWTRLTIALVVVALVLLLAAWTPSLRRPTTTSFREDFPEIVESERNLQKYEQQIQALSVQDQATIPRSWLRLNASETRRSMASLLFDILYDPMRRWNPNESEQIKSEIKSLLSRAANDTRIACDELRNTLLVPDGRSEGQALEMSAELRAATLLSIQLSIDELSFSSHSQFRNLTVAAVQERLRELERYRAWLEDWNSDQSQTNYRARTLAIVELESCRLRFLESVAHHARKNHTAADQALVAAEKMLQKSMDENEREPRVEWYSDLIMLRHYALRQRDLTYHVLSPSNLDGYQQ